MDLKPYIEKNAKLITTVILLMAVVLYLVGGLPSLKAYMGDIRTLAIEFLGLGILSFLFIIVFGVDQGETERGDKIDRILDQFDLEKDYRIFKTSASHIYNIEFYQHFNIVISNAKSDIYLTGDGFSYRDIDNEQIAKEYLAANREALKKGVQIVRVQTESSFARWNVELKSLISEYPKNFKLYLVRQQKNVEPIASVCVVDSELHKTTTAEFMISLTKDIGMERSSLANLAIFSIGDVELSSGIKGKIKTEIDKSTTIRITLENFEEYMK